MTALDMHWAILPVLLASAGGLLIFDLFAHRKAKIVSLANAAIWSSIYILAALGFAAFLWSQYGKEPASLFLAGFVMEKSLSIDNLIVFSAVFAYFKVAAQYQHRILHYGIIGAIVFRMIFVAIGTGSLLLLGPVVGAVFGAVVLWSAYAMWNGMGGDDTEDEVDYENEWYIRALKTRFPVTGSTVGQQFFIKGYMTPLFLCLVTIEISDVMFSFDSVPAVIAVTQQPLLVYSAMIFAILGLRSMYFVLSALMRYLVHLEKAVVVVLAFIGLKLLGHSANQLFGWSLPELSAFQSLSVVLGILAIGVVASMIPATKKLAH